MGSMNCPRSVTPPFAKRVMWELPSTRIVGKDVPGIPIDAILPANDRVGFVDAPPGLFARWVIEDRVGIEVSRSTRPFWKGRSAMCPQRDQIAAQDLVQFVA